jgi:hypothetical protein
MTTDPRLPEGADPADLARLDETRAKLRAVRSDIEGSPLARYQAGQTRGDHAVTGTQSAVRLAVDILMHSDVRDGELLAAALRAVCEDREDDVRSLLDSMDADLVTQLSYRAARLSDLAAHSATGRRS